MISSWPYAPKLSLYLPLSSHVDSPVCPLIYLSMQEIFTQQLLYASYCSRHLEGSAEKNRYTLCSQRNLYSRNKLEIHKFMRKFQIIYVTEVIIGRVIGRI